MAQTGPMRMAFLLPAAALVVIPVGLNAADSRQQTGEGALATRVFWRVHKPGGGSIYLLGSLHFGDESLFPLPEVVEQAYVGSMTIVFETDLRQASEASHSVRTMERARVAPGVTLRDLLSTASFEVFQQAAREFGLDPAMFEGYRAWYCANSMMTVALRRAGVDPARGIDRILFTRAEADEKRIVTFETPAFQLELFAGLSDVQAGELLAQASTEMSQVGDFVMRMLEAYRGGDLTTLRSMINDGFEGLPELKKRFFSERNAAWIQKLKKMAVDPGDTFVVVGSGHLLGEGSLIDLLRDGGYTVTRL